MGKKSENKAVGVSSGGRNTKIHALVEKLALDGSTNPSIVGVGKGYGLGFLATISVNTATLTELSTPYLVMDISSYFRIATRSV